jgi:OOP family OmpA-OmpF porin
MTRRTPLRRRGFALGLVAAIALTGCAAESAATSGASTKPSPSAKSDKDSGLATVPGYDVGEFPPVPLFVLPDLSLLDDSVNAFAIEFNDDLGDIPGVTATPTSCDETGAVVNSNSTFLYGDGSGSYTGPDGTIENRGDGSGSSIINGVVIENLGNGAGSYVGGDGVVIQNHGDGSGSYVDGEGLVIDIVGDGSGTYVGPDGVIENLGNGSGPYVDDDVVNENAGDGSGSYIGGGIIIENFGDGTGTVDGEPVKVDPLPPVPKLGVFPPLAALAPMESCGTTLTFEDGVLFDFNKSDIRADAAKTLDSVAAVLTKLGVTSATISGHTDAIGSDTENESLSQDRADSVAADLMERDVPTVFTAEGFGESRPVAPNEIDGVDNPAGRQLNRRVEIFIPAV